MNMSNNFNEGISNPELLMDRSYLNDLVKSSYEIDNKQIPIYKLIKDFLYKVCQDNRIDDVLLSDFIIKINKIGTLNYHSGKQYFQSLIEKAKLLTTINDELKDIKLYPVDSYERISKISEIKPLVHWFTNEYSMAESHYKNYSVKI